MEELRKQQELLQKQQIKVKRLLYLIGVGVVTVMLLFGLTITYIIFASQGNRESTCATIETSRAEKRAQLAAYAETPPTTQTGRNIEEATKRSLQAWDSLADSLHCKEIGNG